MPEPETIRRIVLVGFMAAGKTTVGRTLAQRLGWRFIDVDEEIQRSEGMTIGDLFRARGEDGFRSMERELTAALCCEGLAVIAPGGGWVTNPDAFASLPPGTLTVWLRISAEEAVRRASADPVERPLLASDAPLQAARALLGTRSALYAAADHTIDVDGLTPDEIAAVIAAQIN